MANNIFEYLKKQTTPTGGSSSNYVNKSETSGGTTKSFIDAIKALGGSSSSYSNNEEKSQTTAKNTTLSDVADNYNNSVAGKIKKSTETLLKAVSLANRARANTGQASPIQTAVEKGGQLINKIDKAITNDSITEAQQHHLDVSYNTKMDTQSVLDKIKNDADYAGNLINADGSFVDYTQTIDDLNAKIENTPSPYDRKAYKAQLSQIEEYKNDQDILLYSEYYKQLEKNGASTEQLNEFKKYVIQNDYNGIERAMANFGGTVEGYVGSTLKGIDTLYAKTADFLGVDYGDTQLADKIIDNAEQLQQITIQNAEGAEKLVYEVYDGMAPFLYALTTMKLGGANVLGDKAAAQKLVDKSLLLSDLGVLGQTMHDNEANGFDFDTSFNNAIQRAALSHITESIGGDAIADVLTGEIGTILLTNTLAYSTKAIANSFILGQSHKNIINQ